MTLHPVILCGGPGSRLWPASTPERPKPFVDLIGGPTLFQRTVSRLGVAAPGVSPIVVTGIAHVDLVRRQLAEIAVQGVILAEPEGRDSAPAIVAAAVLVGRQDPQGLVLVVASDHHVPDAEAFAEGVARGTSAAAAGHLVTFGIAPAGPSSAYGYIEPGETLDAAGQVRRVRRFLEKPDAARAGALIAAGCLWNSGNFLFRADVLLDEVEAHAPGIRAPVEAALDAAADLDSVRPLGAAFREARKVSIDVAVMEKTSRAVVAPVDYAWSDLGAWDAVLEASPRDPARNAVAGAAAVSQSEGCLIRAEPGMQIIALGLHDTAVVAAPGKVLVCALSRAADLKGPLRDLAQRSDAVSTPSLQAAADRLSAWLFDDALPLWWCFGADHARGGFHDRLTWNRRPTDHPRRLRVQARQVFVYAAAARIGWPGPWRAAIEHGLDHIERRHGRPDGLYRTLLNASCEPLDEAAALYDHAFVLLAWASAAAVLPERRAALESDAARLVDRLHEAYGHDRGGLRAGESGLSLEADPMMHLFEAALAWSEVSDAPRWPALARSVAEHFLDRMLDWDGARIAEVFDGDWRPHASRAGKLIKPGHQFEWAWLLGRWARAAGDTRASCAAALLYATGSAGVDPRSGLTLDDLEADLRPAGPGSRLWPQTERIKAVLALESDPAVRARAAHGAILAMESYLAAPTPGLWRDAPAGSVFPPETAALASSLYHIVGAILAVREAADGSADD